MWTGLFYKEMIEMDGEFRHVISFFSNHKLLTPEAVLIDDGLQ